MRHEIDTANRTHVLIADGLLDAAEFARHACCNYKRGGASGGAGGPNNSLNRPEWTGRHFHGSWNTLVDSLSKSWDDGLSVVTRMVEKIKRSVDAPIYRGRKRRWSEDSGEIEIGRLLHGEPAFYQETFRTKVPATQVINVVANLSAKSHITPENILWRGAATIAMIDLMEDSGYSTNLTMWGHSEMCYTDARNDRTLFVARIKEAGDPVNPEMMTNALSAWFLRTVVYGVRFGVNERVNSFLGRNVPDWRDLGSRQKYLELSDDTTIHVPYCTSEHEAVNAARSLLASINKGEDSEPC